VGECIVVHIGDGDWIVVDSCLDRRSRRSVALNYLRSLDVDINSKVKLVVATHWHDDHIAGLAQVLEAAGQAKFVNSAAYSFPELMKLVQLGAKTARQSSATTEYERITQILVERRKNGERKDAVGPVPALANRKLLSLISEDRPIAVEVFSLSPSDGVFNRGAAELQRALSVTERRLRPSLQGPNQLSVVLWVRIGLINVLLGGDLEHVPGVTEGWQAIVQSAERPAGRARFFKVPHHGSANADCPDCWSELLLEKPIAILTPYSPSGLPRRGDVERLCARSSAVLLTGDSTHYGLPRRENAVEKTIRDVAIKRRALVGQMGHVRLRCDAREPDQPLNVDLQNGAQQRCV
jgi:beta-lactamase superfamily II metal-dependent hydrolase